MGIFGSPWIGLEHFERFATNGDFWRVFQNTVIISALRIFVGFPMPIIFALLLNEVKFKGYKRMVQTISYLPHFISWVVVSGILFSFFLQLRRGEPRDHRSFSRAEYWFFILGKIFSIVYFVDVRMEGSRLVRYYLFGRPQWTQRSTVAKIDGANRRQQLFYITLPSISTVVSTMFILSFATVLSTGFEQVLALINTSVMSVGETIDYYIYRIGVTQVNNYSYATAVGLFKSLISLVLVLFTNWGAKKIDEESGLW